MKTKPLTEKQQELLDAMKRGARVHYMKCMGRFNPTPYYFRTDTHDRCTKQAEGLLERGLVVRIKEDGFGGHQLAPTQP